MIYDAQHNMNSPMVDQYDFWKQFYLAQIKYFHNKNNSYY